MSPTNAERTIVLRPVESVVSATCGAVPARRRPEDVEELRQTFIDGVVEQALAEDEQSA